MRRALHGRETHRGDVERGVPCEPGLPLSRVAAHAAQRLDPVRTSLVGGHAGSDVLRNLILEVKTELLPFQWPCRLARTRIKPTISMATGTTPSRRDVEQYLYMLFMRAPLAHDRILHGHGPAAPLRAAIVPREEAAMGVSTDRIRQRQHALARLADWVRLAHQNRHAGSRRVCRWRFVGAIRTQSGCGVPPTLRLADSAP